MCSMGYSYTQHRYIPVILLSVMSILVMLGVATMQAGSGPPMEFCRMSRYAREGRSHRQVDNPALLRLFCAMLMTVRLLHVHMASWGRSPVGLGVGIRG